jgi:hypothetical protein
MSQSVSIMQLLSQSPLLAADNFPIASSANGDARRVSATTLLAFLQASIVVPNAMVTQYDSPTTSGLTFTISQVNGVSVPVWLRLTPTGTLSTYTVVFPPKGTAVDGQEILLTTSQTITTLNLIAVGCNLTYTFYSNTSANGSFRQKYDAPSNTWVPVA